MSKTVPTDDWRFERKFLVSTLSRFDIENVVRFHPAMFSEIYQKRNINNIYLDTFNHTNFFKSVDGQSQRLKVRIRWYGDLLGVAQNPNLEFKVKNGQLGRKQQYALNDFCINKDLSNDGLREVIEDSNIPDDIKNFMHDFNMTLLNSYTRKYYQSSDKRYRITIDFDMRYIKLLSHQKISFLCSLGDDITILELKYGREHDDNVAEITNSFPFRMTKSSKYVTGIEKFLTSTI